jgi:two-component system, cell cycle response regulator DivK
MLRHEEAPKPKTVLVVEDNRDELVIYTTLLGHAGYNVVSATDFDSALSVANSERPDLAIVDVNLGHRRYDGCDLVEAFRAAANTAAMPVIAHTAFGDVYRESLQRAGCDRIIHKPSNPSAILDAVRELIGPPVPDEPDEALRPRTSPPTEPLEDA